MKKTFLLLTFLFFFNNQVLAVKLSEALIEAYKNNPELNAERENIKASQEDLKISKSEFYPSVTLSSSKSKENTKKLTDRTGANTSFTDVDPETQTVTVEQKLFQGFAGMAGVEKNKIGLSNFWREANERASEFVKTEEYKNGNEHDRMEMLREIYKGENMEMGEGNMIQNPLIQAGIQDEEDIVENYDMDDEYYEDQMGELDEEQEMLFRE